jgi:hypothetical protein
MPRDASKALRDVAMRQHGLGSEEAAQLVTRLGGRPPEAKGANEVDPLKYATDHMEKWEAVKRENAQMRWRVARRASLAKHDEEDRRADGKRLLNVVEQLTQQRAAKQQEQQKAIRLENDEVRYRQARRASLAHHQAEARHDEGRQLVTEVEKRTQERAEAKVPVQEAIRRENEEARYRQARRASLAHHQAEARHDEGRQLVTEVEKRTQERAVAKLERQHTMRTENKGINYRRARRVSLVGHEIEAREEEGRRLVEEVEARTHQRAALQEEEQDRIRRANLEKQQRVGDAVSRFMQVAADPPHVRRRRASIAKHEAQEEGTYVHPHAQDAMDRSEAAVPQPARGMRPLPTSRASRLNSAPTRSTNAERRDGHGPSDPYAGAPASSRASKPSPRQYLPSAGGLSAPYHAPMHPSPSMPAPMTYGMPTQSSAMPPPYPPPFPPPMLPPMPPPPQHEQPFSPYAAFPPNLSYAEFCWYIWWMQNGGATSWQQQPPHA